MHNTLLFPRVRRTTSVADEIRSWIIEGKLKPGDKLPTEAELCASFNISRTTLREAVQCLRCKGYLDVTPGRGSYVTVPCISNILTDLAVVAKLSHGSGHPAEIQPLHLLMQKHVLHNLAAAPEAEKKELQAYTLNPAAEAGIHAQMEEDWYLAMARAARTPVAQLFLQTLFTLQRPSRLAYYSSPAAVMNTIQVQMHVNNAILNRDLAAAERALTHHILTPPRR